MSFLSVRPCNDHTWYYCYAQDSKDCVLKTMMDGEGFICFVSGLVSGVTVHFDSPVNEGDDVEMTCEYSNPNGNSVVVTWYRQTEPGVQHINAIWIYSVSLDQTKNAAEEGFQKKFELISQPSSLRSHRIKLLSAEKKDEGGYWCSVYVVLYRYGTSPRRQLHVTGEEFSHT